MGFSPPPPSSTKRKKPSDLHLPCAESAARTPICVNGRRSNYVVYMYILTIWFILSCLKRSRVHQRRLYLRSKGKLLISGQSVWVGHLDHSTSGKCSWFKCFPTIMVPALKLVKVLPNMFVGIILHLTASTPKPVLTFDKYAPLDNEH